MMCMCASSGVRPPLRRLHGAQAVATFSHVVRPPLARGKHVVEGQLPRRAAIDAAEFVAQEQVEPRERRIFVGPDELPKRDHRGQLERNARAVDLALVMGDDVDPLEEHRLDRGLPRPEAQRVIGQRRVIGVEDQRRAGVGMSDELGMIQCSSLSSGGPNCCSPAPSHSRRRGHRPVFPCCPPDANPA